jgi:hypothetical protein
MVRKAFWKRILLANERQRRDSGHEVLYEVPALCETDPHSRSRALDHPRYVAFCRAGPGSLGTLQESTRGLDLPACRDRQIH